MLIGSPKLACGPFDRGRATIPLKNSLEDSLRTNRKAERLAQSPSHSMIDGDQPNRNERSMVGPAWTDLRVHVFNRRRLDIGGNFCYSRDAFGDPLDLFFQIGIRQNTGNIDPAAVAFDGEYYVARFR